MAANFAKLPELRAGGKCSAAIYDSRLPE